MAMTTCDIDWIADKLFFKHDLTTLQKPRLRIQV